ncbi:MAG: T9SS type A sorting domain-containing protein [Cyclobacteriaceae bacterium]
MDDGYELFFNDPMNGWAYLTRAYQDEYKIFSTGDGGENWEMIFQTPESSYGYFKSMNFKDPHMGILITSDGLALLTNDGGETWNAEQYALSPSDAFSQTFFLENYAYIATYYDIYRKDLSVSSASPLFRNGNNAVIYPNPAGDFIEIANLKEYTRVELYSSMGAKILETHDTRINISHLAAGIYFLKAGGKAYKFIKK